MVHVQIYFLKPLLLIYLSPFMIDIYLQNIKINLMDTRNGQKNKFLMSWSKYLPRRKSSTGSLFMNSWLELFQTGLSNLVSSSSSASSLLYFSEEEGEDGRGRRVSFIERRRSLLESLRLFSILFLSNLFFLFFFSFFLISRCNRLKTKLFFYIEFSRVIFLEI